MKITAAIITVVTAFASFASAQQDADTFSTDTYDYVIVGGGVAGMNACICHRMSEPILILSIFT